MSGSERSLDLLVPGLLGPWPKTQCSFVCEALELPALSQILARGRVAPNFGTWNGSVAGAVFGVFGGAGDEGAAAMSARVDLQLQDDPGPGWMRADPVHLRADPASISLTYGQPLGLNQADATALVDELRATQPFDLIQFSDPNRWYLPVTADISTCAPSGVAGAGMETTLPRGNDGRAWRTRLTEAQMVLHASVVNERREARGLAPVNSLWLWGGGVPPNLELDRFTVIHSDDPVARGIAATHSTRCSDVLQNFGRLALADAPTRELVTLETVHGLAAAGNVEAWRAGIEQIEELWLKPALKALRAGKFDRLSLHTASAPALVVTRGALWRFWHRARPLGEALRAFTNDH